MPMCAFRVIAAAVDRVHRALARRNKQQLLLSHMCQMLYIDVEVDLVSFMT